MGYYLRVLSTSAEPAPHDAIRECFANDGIKAQVLVDDEKESWSEAILAHPSGDEFAELERNPVEPGELGAEELAELIDEVSACQPASAAAWLKAYLPTIRTIYSIRVLFAADQDDGWTAIRSAQQTLFRHAPGILQADGEGFSNEDGYHILWQFDDDASGKWWMAVLDDEGHWVTFEMSLGNAKHRQAFLDGRVPRGIKPSRAS